MNILRAKLTKTAVPTITRLANGEILDFELTTENPNMYDLKVVRTGSSVGRLVSNAQTKSLNEGAKQINVVLEATQQNNADDIYVHDQHSIFVGEESDDGDDGDNNDVDDEIPDEITMSAAARPKLLNGTATILGKSAELSAAPLTTLRKRSAASSKSKLIKKQKIPEVRPTAISRTPRIETVTTIDEFSEEKYLDDDCDDVAVTEEQIRTHAEEEMNQMNLDKLEVEMAERKKLERIRFEQSAEIAELRSQLTSKIHKIEQLESLVSTQKKEIDVAAATIAAASSVQTPAPPQNKAKNEKVALTKPQLFNAVKKYLNPSMMALLRMELFGDPEREYKPDERDFSMQLLEHSSTADGYGSGKNAKGSFYDFMRSEWRFRLPPRNVVEKWIRQRQETADDDDDLDDC